MSLRSALRTSLSKTVKHSYKRRFISLQTASSHEPTSFISGRSDKTSTVSNDLTVRVLNLLRKTSTESDYEIWKNVVSSLVEDRPRAKRVGG
jgi:hypothetical protein